MPLINIAKDDTKPLFIDPSDISGVQFDADEKGKVTLYLFNSQGRLFGGALDYWNIDSADLIEKLRDAGVSLVHFPVRWPEDNNSFKEYDHYINPTAVTYATITETTPEGNLGAIVGVKGVGMEESYNNTSAEWSELLTAVRAVKPLLEYKPAEAETRWANAAALYIDPKSVTRIVDDGYQVNVYFEQSGSLDVQVRKFDVNDIVNDMPDFKPADENNLREIFNEAQRRTDAMNKAAHFNFANDLAAANGNLIAIPSPTRATHISRQDIGSISLMDDRDGKKKVLAIYPPQRLDQSRDIITFYFDTQEDALKALKALTGEKEPLPPATKPKPPTP